MAARGINKQAEARAPHVASLPTASGGISRAAYARVVQAGLAAEPLLAEAGLTRAEIERPDARIPVRSQIRVLDEAARRLGDEFLGMHLAQSVDLRQIGLIYYVLASCRDLHTALTRLARYSSINNEGVQIDVRAGKELVVSFRHVGVPRTSDRHQIEFFAAILVRLCRHFVGRNLSPARIRLMHRRPRIAPDLASFLGCRVEFGAPVDQVVFPAEVNDASFVQADPYLNEIMLAYCDEILRRRRAKPGDWRARVENVIAPLLPHGEATLAAVARKLSVSSRTLARRLASEGVTFAEVLQDLRARLAREYFDEPGMSITRIAWLLGYQGPSAFSHAFKRWTGRSPRQMRGATAGMPRMTGFDTSLA